MEETREDCYYYLYSVCKRGPSCIYRHNAFSKQNPVLCETWSKTKQCREDCPFRHSYYHLKKNRSDDFCFWEDKESGCTKSFCEFRHKDSSRDAWKEGGVKSLEQIRKEKNARKRLDESMIEVDPEDFERERREKKKLKIESKKNKFTGVFEEVSADNKSEQIGNEIPEYEKSTIGELANNIDEHKIQITTERNVPIEDIAAKNTTETKVKEEVSKKFSNENIAAKNFGEFGVKQDAFKKLPIEEEKSKNNVESNFKEDNSNKSFTDGNSAKNIVESGNKGETSKKLTEINKGDKLSENSKTEEHFKASDSNTKIKDQSKDKIDSSATNNKDKIIDDIKELEDELEDIDNILNDL